MKAHERAGMDLSVVLVNWNALEMTARALTSIREMTSGLNYEVFVVDNGSTDDNSRKEIPERFPWVRFISNPQNYGFSRANNQAIRRSQGRHILLLNADTFQIENALGLSVEYMDRHPEVGALGIKHLNDDADRTVQPSHYDFPDPWEDSRILLAILEPRSEASLPEPTDEARDVDWVVGSFLLMRRECYEEVGELDERFFVYDEDIDWCLRARRRGWKVRFWGGAKMVHIGSASAPLVRDKNFMQFRSHLSYIAKNHSLTAAIAYYAAMGIRLSMGTGKHIALLAVGRSDLARVRGRFVRQRNFILMRPGRRGI